MQARGGGRRVRLDRLAQFERGGQDVLLLVPPMPAEVRKEGRFRVLEPD